VPAGTLSGIWDVSDPVASGDGAEGSVAGGSDWAMAVRHCGPGGGSATSPSGRFIPWRPDGSEGGFCSHRAGAAVPGSRPQRWEPSSCAALGPISADSRLAAQVMCGLLLRDPAPFRHFGFRLWDRRRSTVSSGSWSTRFGIDRVAELAPAPHCFMRSHLIHEVTVPRPSVALRELGLGVGAPDRKVATVDHTMCRLPPRRAFAF